MHHELFHQIFTLICRMSCCFYCLGLLTDLLELHVGLLSAPHCFKAFFITVPMANNALRHLPAHWSQPLVDSSADGRSPLLCILHQEACGTESRRLRRNTPRQGAYLGCCSTRRSFRLWQTSSASTKTVVRVPRCAPLRLHSVQSSMALRMGLRDAVEVLTR